MSQGCVENASLTGWWIVLSGDDRCPLCGQLDMWYVILNGSVEVDHPDGRAETLCMGNSFGISPSLDKQYVHGEVRSKGDDCQVKYL